MGHPLEKVFATLCFATGIFLFGMVFIGLGQKAAEGALFENPKQTNEQILRSVYSDDCNNRGGRFVDTDPALCISDEGTIERTYRGQK